MMTGKRTQQILAVLVIVLLGFVAYFVLTTPDQRDLGQKIEDAVDEIPNGLDKAAEQLEDRTPIEKLQDKAEDVKEDLQ
jgi:predicted PurR-regulated permease PerM